MDAGARRWDLTAGTDGSSAYEVMEEFERQGHGNRIWCAISHFSYDDPVVMPGQPDAAHLHMFWGNTSTDAFSTPEQVRTSGSTSCEGGTAYRSSLWMPALRTAAGEPVLPERTWIYYKAFLGPAYPESSHRLLQRVPEGLQMLASRATANAGDAHFRHWWTGDGLLRVSMRFPSCVATEDGTRTGRPVLDFRDMAGADAAVVNSHVAYPGGPARNEVGCPASHPYRYPTPMINLEWDADATGPAPHLSSDAAAGAAPFSTMHADYVVGIDGDLNETMLRCAVEGHSCAFEGRRRGLPDRFLAPDGARLYEDSVTLRPGVDRTPFGVLPPTAGHHAAHG